MTNPTMTGPEHRCPPALAGVLVAMLLGLGLAAPLAAQEVEEPDPGAEAPAEAAPIEGEESGFEIGEPTSESDLDAIDEILEGEIEVLGGAAHSYDPGDRRDPFKSLLVTGTDTEDARGPRPEGVPGLLIDEIRLSGIYKTARGWVAQVQAAANEKGYLIQEGDQLYDGDVVSVTAEEVIFRQIVRDPAALKPFREVPKRLNP
jgi:hypothetical protein